jgi:hypothetical protein
MGVVPLYVSPDGICSSDPSVFRKITKELYGTKTFPWVKPEKMGRSGSRGGNRGGRKKLLKLPE